MESLLTRRTLSKLVAALLACGVAGCLPQPPPVGPPADAPLGGPPPPDIISEPQCLFEVEEWGQYTLPLGSYCPSLLGRADLIVACEKDNALTDENVSEVRVSPDGRSIAFKVVQTGTCTILPDAEEGERFAGTSIGSLGRPVILGGLLAMAALGGVLVLLDRAPRR